MHPVIIFGFKIQGALPANQLSIAEKIGEFVNTELLSLSKLQEKITDTENFNRLKPEIETHIDSFLRTRLKDTFPMLAMLIGDKTINQLKTAFMLELETLFPEIMKSYLTRLETELDIKKTVVKKIASVSIQETETRFYQVAHGQIIKMQIAGTFVGILTGLLHLLLNTQLYG